MTYAETAPAPPPSIVTQFTADEGNLVARAQQRDVRAFETLYRQHVPRIYAVCLRMTANVRLAEEMAQKTFVVGWEKLPLFRGDSALGSWLHRIAVNEVLAELRGDQRRTRRILFTEDLEAFETPSIGASPGIRLDLEEAIAQLPPQARVVFVLHAVEGWSHEEIARELGVAIGTSKAQLHRARHLLQETLT